MSETEEYKEGSVVLVPEGKPYFARKRPETKKGSRKVERQKKKLVPVLAEGEYEGESVLYAPEEEEEIDAWEREMKAYGGGEEREEEGGFGEEGEEGEFGEEGGFGEEDESPRKEEEEEFEEEEEEEPRVKGAQYEKREELAYAKVAIPAAHRARMAELGIKIPEYEMKLVPKQVVRRIYETELMHPSYQFMRVGPGGKLLPLVGREPRPVKYLDEDPSPKPKTAYSPDIKVESKQNPYDSRFPFGTYVSFSDIPKGAGTLNGVVMGFTKEGIEVSVNGRIYFVEYENASLKVAPKPSKRKEKGPSKDMKIEDVYPLAEIPHIFREIVVKAYIEILSTIREPFKPSKKTSIIDKKMLGQEPMSWDDYYASEFEKWTFARYYSQIENEIDRDQIREEAEKLVAYESSMEGLLGQVTSLLPDGELKYSTNINDVLAALRAQRQLTVFQAQLIQTLEKEIASGAGGKQEYVSTYVSARRPKGEIAPPEQYYRQLTGERFRSSDLHRPRLVFPSMLKSNLYLVKHWPLF